MKKITLKVCNKNKRVCGGGGGGEKSQKYNDTFRKMGQSLIIGQLKIY